MKKIRKGKKMLLILIVAIIAVILAVIIVRTIINKSKPEELPQSGTVTQLPEIVYSGMEVRNVQMEYLKDNNQTIIKMQICNTTSEKVENNTFDMLWIDSNGKVVGKLENNTIESLEVGEEMDFNTILPGDLTTTKEVKLVKK